MITAPEIDIVTIGKDRRSPMLIGKLLEIWETSVRASHHFLTEADIVRLTPQAEWASGLSGATDATAKAIRSLYWK